MPVTDIKEVSGQKVYATELNQRVPLWTDGCRYQGVWVDYVRDWDVLADDGRVLFRAEPNESAGYALLVYRASCPGESPKAVLLTGDKRPYPLFNTSHVALKGHSFLASDYWSETRKDDRPLWMTQVIKTILGEAPTNPAARLFLEHVEVENGMPVAPK